MARDSHILFTVLLIIAVGASADDRTIDIQAGNHSALQDLLCNGSLSSNTTLQLQPGDHVISREGFCTLGVGSVMNVRLIGAGVLNTTVVCTGKWGFGFSSTQNVVIEGLTFVDCGAAVGLYSNMTAVLYLNTSQSVSVSHVTFVNIFGFGVFGNSLTIVSMSDVYFGGCAENCTCVGASFTSDDVARSATIKRCTFAGLGHVGSDGEEYYDGTAGLQLQGHVVADIRDCSFIGNRGMGLFVNTPNVSTSILNCNFSGNIAARGAALNVMSECLNVTGSRFYDNVAYTGAAMLIKVDLMQGGVCDGSPVVLSATTFINNSACIGAAIYAADEYEYNKKPYSLNLIDMKVIANKRILSCNASNDRGAVVYYNDIDNVSISGSYSTGSQFIENEKGTVQGVGTHLHLLGMVSFQNNTGENGAAIYLTNNANLFFHSNSEVNFTDNIATGFGGAIYIGGDPSIPLHYCAVHFIGVNHAINFQGNRAKIDADSIYATSMYYCHLDSYIPNYWPKTESEYHTFYNMDNSNNQTNNSQMLSFPAKLDLWGCSYRISGVVPACNISEISIYPGATLQFNATLMDYAGRISPSVLFAEVVRSGSSDATDVSISSQQEVQWISKRYTTIEYQIFGPGNTSVCLKLLTRPGVISQNIAVTLKQCEAGFELKSFQCKCLDFLYKFGITCDINQGTVKRSGLQQWIGLYSYRSEAISSTCPLGYCNNITYTRLGSSDICAGSRIGVLCGQCPSNLSVVFGSSECRKCSNVWLLTIFLYAITGLLVVTGLFLFNITVTSGFLYGLIFYANILIVNRTIFFGQSSLMPLDIIVSFVNLDLGFPLCFYNGMVDWVKTLLQFAFPAYLIIISAIIYIGSGYFLNWSSDDAAESCMHKVSRCIRKRAVSVIATLFYVSYSKVLRTGIEIFTYAEMHLKNCTVVKVWFYDGTINYLSGYHIVLFSFAIVVSAFLIVYTLALTFIPISSILSEKCMVFEQLYNKIPLPLIDAYYAPYKGQWRFWLGVKLWLVVLLYGLSTFLGPDKPSLLLLIHAVLVIIFLFIQCTIMPFGKTYFGTEDNCKWSSVLMHLRNALDLFYMLNYSLLALIVSYLLATDANNANSIQLRAVVGVFVGLSIFGFGCSIFCIIASSFDRYCGRRKMSPLNLSGSTTNEDIPLATSVFHADYSSDVYRESILS